MVADPGNAGWAQGWAAPATVTADWEKMQLPTTWQNAGLNFSGVLWFRREVDIPVEWAGKALTLRIGACDKSDNTYFNNVEVGSVRIEEREDAWCLPRTYPIPAELVQPGKNVIAVRVFSHMYAGGMIGPASVMRLSLAGTPDAAPIVLTGDWQYKVERNFGCYLCLIRRRPRRGRGTPTRPPCSSTA